MQEYIVVQASVDDSLQEFSRYLWQQKIPHRIVTDNDRQLLLVGSESDAVLVSGAYRAYQESGGREGGGKMPDLGREQASDPALSVLFARLRSAPVTVILMLLSILGFILVEMDPQFNYVKLFTFYEFESHGRAIIFSLPKGEYWRLITPIFLHFSWLHIVFNVLWLWELGYRVERMQGSISMIGIVMTMGLGSNIAQSMYAEVSVFGGMSGVIYGLLGYGWMWSTLCPRLSVGIPRPVIAFMLVWLVACMMGVASLLGAGAVANAAHVGGLVMGMLLGIGAGLIARASGRA